MTRLPSHSARLARLWLAAIDAWTSGPDGAPVCPARDVVRVAIARDSGKVHAIVDPGEQRRAVAWVERLSREAGELDELGGAALAWAAVSVWGDLRVTPWTRLETALARLAVVVEPPGREIEAMRAADRLRATMERAGDELWGRAGSVLEASP